MTLNTLKNAIVKLGGTVTVETKNLIGYMNQPYTNTTLYATLGSYEIEFNDGSDYFTSRRIGTKYDMGSDYNPGGWSFCRRIKDLKSL